MDIETLVNICNEFPDVRIKAIKDEQLGENYNSGYGSWRGEYAEPALFFNGDGYMTLKDLVPYLDKLASGAEFEGYKGGLFSYIYGSPIHFEYADYCSTDYNLTEFIHQDDITDDLIKYLN